MKQVTEFEGCYFLHVAYRISYLLLHNITLNYTNSRENDTLKTDILLLFFFFFAASSRNNQYRGIAWKIFLLHTMKS